MKRIKKMVKSYTFLSFVIAFLLCYLRMSGLDPQGLIFFVFGLDPLVNHVIDAEPFRDMVHNHHLYALRILTALIYGVFFDCLRYLIQKYAAQKYVVFFKYLKRGVLILMLIGVLTLVSFGILINFFLAILNL
ncbi:hypothetical protein COL14_26970 [Bacillus thuringiensis]|nr:hypothetical protein COL14_26970 [Bacillus thuringiensis]